MTNKTIESIADRLNVKISEVRELELKFNQKKLEVSDAKSELYREMLKLGVSKDDLSRIGINIVDSQDINVSNSNLNL